MRIVVLLLLLRGIADANPTEQPPLPSKWHFGIEAMTDFPLQVGVQVWAELPYRIRLTMSAGELPDLYLQTINSIAVSAGAYNQSQASLITELLDRAATWRLQVGWRPFKSRGAYFEAGFGILTLEKGLVLGDVVQLATSFPVPRQGPTGFGYRADTVVETVGVEVGWIWYPWRNLTIRLSLAFASAVSAQVSITPNFLSTAQRPFTRFAEDYAEELIEKHLIIPTVGLAAGWRLF